ncbi:MAG: CocE/NonD family hydrolase [Gemmatimonadota bacterium]
MSTALCRGWRLPPKRNRVVLTSGLQVPMRDGVTLVTDHYMPLASDPRPTLLIRSPYGRGFEYGLLMAQLYAERGYHVLLQSTRGTFGSGGGFFPVVHEAADGQDTVAWLRRQPWFDGRLGTVGPSYLGWVQWALATDPPPELRAMVVHTAPHDMARLAFGRGPFQLMFLLQWSEMVANQEHIGMVRGTARMIRPERRLAPVLDTLPMEAAADNLGGAGAPWFREWVSGPDPEGPYWDPYRATAALRRSTVPTLLAGGFQDPFLDQTLEQYQVLHERGVEVGLTLGPWTHLGIDMSVLVPESLAWLDAHLAGEGPPPRRRPVRVWVGGRKQWQDLAAWPPPDGVADQIWQLQPHGRLSPSAAAGGATTFRYDPADPTPSVGGRVLAVGGAGVQDNTRLEARPDVVTFTSVPLSVPVEVLGAPVAELQVSSDNPNIDLFARLCDVDRRGRSRNITDRIVRVPAAAAGPGGARTVRITLDDTAHQFQAGHRIRLQISAGAHPRYARNLGTGEPAGTGTTMKPATITIHHGGGLCSSLTLPAAQD